MSDSLFNSGLVNHTKRILTKYERVSTIALHIDDMVKRNMAPKCSTFRELIAKAKFEKQFKIINDKLKIRRSFPNVAKSCDIVHVSECE